MKLIKRLFNKYIQEEVQKQIYTNNEVLKTSGVGLQWFKGLFPLTHSDTSRPVENSSILFRCVQLINDNISEAPLKFADRRSNKDLVYTHPIVELFDTPDGDNPYSDFISKSGMYYSLYGESFWFYIPDSVDYRNRRRARLVNLHPKYMFEKLDSMNRVEYWNYNVDNTNPKPNDSGNQPIPAEFIIHVKNGNPYNGNRGLSVLDALKDKILINRRALDFQANFLENGANPGMVITFPNVTQQLTPDQKSQMKAMIKEFDQRHAGPGKAGKTGALPPGTDLKTVGIDHDKMQFLEILNYTDDEIITAMGLHKTILGKTEDINRAISNDQREMLWQYTLKPMTTKFEQAINYKLLRGIDPSIEAYYDYSQIIPEQRLTVTDIPILMNAGFTRNEINRRLGLNFDEDPSGDVRLVPFNYQPLEYVTGPQAQPANNQNKMIDVTPKTKQIEHVDKSARNGRIAKINNTLRNKSEKQVESRVSRFAGEQKARVLKILLGNKKAASINGDSLIQDIQEIFNSEDDLIEQSMKPIFTEVITNAGQSALKILDINRDYIFNSDVLLNRTNKIKGINQTTFNQIKQHISDAVNGVDNEGKAESVDQIARRIKNVYNDFPKWRAKRIALTETSSMISEAQQKEYEQNGVPYNSWSTAGDSNVREEHRANEAQGPIPVGQAFSNGERYPGESSVNCRCDLVPEITL